MKAIEILMNLGCSNCLPCGISCHDGVIFENSVKRNEKELKFMDGKFKPKSVYLEFCSDRVPPMLWHKLGDYDVKVVFDFGTYTYWELE